jgi:hypothetical protein
MKDFSKTGLQKLIQDVYVGGLNGRTPEELEKGAEQLKEIVDTLYSVAASKRQERKS